MLAPDGVLGSVFSLWLSSEFVTWACYEAGKLVPFGRHCFCGPFMLHGRSGGNILQNVFCCKETPVCQT